MDRSGQLRFPSFLNHNFTIRCRSVPRHRTAPSEDRGARYHGSKRTIKLFLDAWYSVEMSFAGTETMGGEGKSACVAAYA